MNEYTAIGPAGGQVARGHDPNGNRTDDGARVLVWDAFNRLVGVARKSDGAPIAAYSYLPDGRRSRKVVYSQATPGQVEREVRFVWDGAQEVEEQSAAGTTLASFVWSPVYVDELVEYRREAAHPLGSGSFFAHQDARCDVVAVTNASGQVVEKRRFDDFGREEVRDASGSVVASSPSGLEWGFQGRRRDPETGWLYFRARYYSAEEGRFLSRDPVWDAGNVGGWYTFVGNGPVSGRDPSGLLDDGEIWKRVARIALGRVARRAGPPPVAVVRGIAGAVKDVCEVASETQAAQAARRGAVAQYDQLAQVGQRRAREWDASYDDEPLWAKSPWVQIFKQKLGRYPTSQEMRTFNETPGGEWEKFMAATGQPAQEPGPQPAGPQLEPQPLAAESADVADVASTCPVGADTGRQGGYADKGAHPLRTLANEERTGRKKGHKVHWKKEARKEAEERHREAKRQREAEQRGEEEDEWGDARGGPPGRPRPK